MAHEQEPKQDLYEDTLTFEEEEEPRLSFLDRILGIFTSPSAVMADIKRNPKPLLLPFAIVFLIVGLGLYLQLDGLQSMMIDQLRRQNPDITINAEMLRTLSISSMVGGILGAVMSPIIKAAFAHGLSILFGGSGRFKQTFAVIIYAYMVTVLGVILRSIIIFFTGNAMISFSPALFFGTPDTTNALYMLASSLDIFNLWYLGVSIIGIKIVHEISTAKAAAVVFIPWVIVILFSVIPNLMM